MIDSDKISFRRMQMEDLELMYKWLNKPHVRQWYDRDKGSSLEAIEERYGPKIKDEKPTDCYLVFCEAKPFGYIQKYKVNDWPEFADYVGYDNGASSVDLFIGEPSFMGKGYGSMMLKKFVDEVVFADPKINRCIIGPEPKNARAIRSYEKAGFKYVKTVQVGNEPNPTYVMELKKEDLER